MAPRGGRRYTALVVVDVRGRARVGFGDSKRSGAYTRGSFAFGGDGGGGGGEGGIVAKGERKGGCCCWWLWSMGRRY